LSSVQNSEDKKVDNLPMVQMSNIKARGFETERFYAEGCRNEDGLAKASSSKAAIWGSGFWPPEWTAVRSGFQNEKWSPNWEVEE